MHKWSSKCSTRWQTDTSTTCGLAHPTRSKRPSKILGISACCFLTGRHKNHLQLITLRQPVLGSSSCSRSRHPCFQEKLVQSIPTLTLRRTRTRKTSNCLVWHLPCWTSAKTTGSYTSNPPSHRR